MITCNMIGRMGNQMFQIATTAAHAWRTGQQFAFPTTASGSYTGETYFHHLPKVNPRCPFRIYNEKGHHYTPIPDHIRDAKLNGYWQCEKYFMEYRQEVIELFGIKQQTLYPYSCSIHIRLGDYVAFKDKHPPVSVEYLDMAMRHIYEQTNGEVFFALFSDNFDEARKMIWQTKFYQEYNNKVAFAFEQHAKPLIALSFMSSMAHNIIANSSFSWWGAWLNPNPDKIVIAPKVWFGPGNSNLTDRDIVPENWIRL